MRFEEESSRIQVRELGDLSHRIPAALPKVVSRGWQADARDGIVRSPVVIGFPLGSLSSFVGVSRGAGKRQHEKSPDG
jgi:hypothetical protein